MKKFLLIFTIFVTNVAYSQMQLGQSFGKICKNSFVIKIDTNSVTKFVTSVPKLNVIVINFFSEQMVSNVASVTYLDKDDTIRTINDLNRLFVKNSTNSWQILDNVVAVFDEGTFYYFWKLPIRTNFIK